MDRISDLFIGTDKDDTIVYIKIVSAFGNLLIMGDDQKDEVIENSYYFQIKNEFIIDAVHTLYNKVLDKFIYFEVRIQKISFNSVNF